MTKDVSNWPGLSAPGEFCVQRREVACFIKMFIMHCMHSFQHPSGALWFLSSFPTTVFLYPCELSSLSRKVFFFILFIICHVNILQQDESSYTTLGSYGSWHAVLFCFFHVCERHWFPSSAILSWSKYHSVHHPPTSVFCDLVTLHFCSRCQLEGRIFFFLCHL